MDRRGPRPQPLDRLHARQRLFDGGVRTSRCRQPAVGEHVGGHDQGGDLREVQRVEPFGDSVGVALRFAVAEPVTRRRHDFAASQGSKGHHIAQVDRPLVDRNQPDAGRGRRNGRRRRGEGRQNDRDQERKCAAAEPHAAILSVEVTAVRPPLNRPLARDYSRGMRTLPRPVVPPQHVPGRSDGRSPGPRQPATRRRSHPRRPAAPAAHPPVKRRPVAAASVTVTITVTDGKGGAPIGGVKVTASIEGTEKDAQTTAGGIARFLSVKPGEYRVRFEHENYITLERDIVVKGVALDLTVPLSAAPAPPPKAPEPAASANNAPAGDARALSIVDFLESNHLSGRDPSRTDQLGCTASAKTTLIQVRDSLEEKSLSDADEVLYVVAGEGTLRLGNKDVSLAAGGLAVVPRGTARGLTRKGKNPLMVLSVVSGPPCTAGMTNSK